MEKRNLVIKITVPFCVKKCEYCTRPIVEDCDSQSLHTYMEAVQKEIQANVGQFSDYRIRAIHFGGGSASMANPQDVSAIVNFIKENYATVEDIPVTIRSSATNINEASMPFFECAGITRFDFEVMSLSPANSVVLNQGDSLKDLSVIANRFLHAQEKSNLGIVLVFGSAEAGRDNFARSLVEFLNMPASHLILQEYEGESPLSEEEKESQLEEARSLLIDGGFTEYAPLKFARSGNEDVYTLRVAKRCEILAFGLGAISYIEGVWSKNTSDLSSYLAHSDDYSQITSDVKVNKAELK